MARILYSIQGVGMGHAMRSRPIIKHLQSEGHEVLITANNKAYKFFKPFYPETQKLKGIDFVLDEEGRIKFFGTVLEYLKKLPFYSYYNLKKLIKIIESYKPDLVITDFEPFAQFISHFYRLPLVSIDNQHRITHCKLDIPKIYYDEYLAAKAVVKTFILKADYYIITDFAGGEIRKDEEKTFVVSPIIRADVLAKQPTTEEHVLVYMWKEYATNVLPILKKITDQKFIVYGLDRDKKMGNVTCKKFSTDGMATDLASAKAIIMNAGFTTISEALYLKKPILAQPIGGQFEQILNGLGIERKGYGMMAEDLDEEKINNFLNKLPEFNKNLDKVHLAGNDRVFEILDNIIKKEVK